MSELIRLTKRIAQTGKYSRHEADKLVAVGKVSVNGVIALSGTKVSDAGTEEIVVNGVPLQGGNDDIYKFHKPRKVMSTYSDPSGRRTLADFEGLSNSRMGYSGRLDYDSEGLMLFTSNGGLIYKMQHSDFNVEKEYIVDSDKEISAQWLRRLRAGIDIEGEHFLPCKVERVSKCKYNVVLIEGKKREIRRMFKEAGAKVMRLIRVRIASVLLWNMPEGALIKLSEIEREELVKCIG
ncbi:pseudouridine synthase [Deferribacterales bacterium RsTz2092]|nr:pseudouridine synthase [Deferribacterales bacterium]